MQYIFLIIFVLDPDGALKFGRVTLHLNITSMLWPCSLMLKVWYLYICSKMPKAEKVNSSTYIAFTTNIRHGQVK